jgi:hypothetical protein
MTIEHVLHNLRRQVAAVGITVDALLKILCH